MMAQEGVLWDIGASVGGRFASEEKSCFTGDFLEWLYFDHIASGAMEISTTAHNEELEAMWYYVVPAYKLMLNI